MSSVTDFVCAQEILVPLKAMAEVLVFSRVQGFPASLCLYKIAQREWQTLQSFRVIPGNKLTRNPQVLVCSCVLFQHMNQFWDWRKRLYMPDPKVKVNGKECKVLSQSMCTSSLWTKPLVHSNGKMHKKINTEKT